MLMQEAFIDRIPHSYISEADKLLDVLDETRGELSSYITLEHARQIHNTAYRLFNIWTHSYMQCLSVYRHMLLHMVKYFETGNGSYLVTTYTPSHRGSVGFETFKDVCLTTHTYVSAISTGTGYMLTPVVLSSTTIDYILGMNNTLDIPIDLTDRWGFDHLLQGGRLIIDNFNVDTNPLLVDLMAAGKALDQSRHTSVDDLCSDIHRLYSSVYGIHRVLVVNMLMFDVLRNAFEHILL